MRWVTAAGGNHDDYGSAIAVSPAGQVFVAGTFNRHATFGPFRLQGPPQDPSVFVAMLAAEPSLHTEPPGTRVALPTGGFYLDGERDVRYLLQSSRDLRTWADFLTLTNASGRTGFEGVSAAASEPRRFYRAMQLRR